VVEDAIRIRTLADVELFWLAEADASVDLKGSVDDVCAWIELTPVRFRCMLRCKAAALSAAKATHGQRLANEVCEVEVVLDKGSGRI